MSKVRILAIGHSYVLRANRAFAREVARDRDFEITIGAPHFFHGDLRPIECEPEPAGSPLHLVPIRAHWTRYVHVFRYSRTALNRLILDGRFDAIHAWEEPYIFAGFQIARLAKQSRSRFCFWTSQNVNKHYPPPFNYFERACLAIAHRWIACGTSVFDNLVARGYPRDQGRTITLSVDTTTFRPRPEEEREAVRRELGLTAPVIGFVGRLVPAKGIRILMQALEKLETDVAWSLLLLGSGEMKQEIEHWAAGLGFQDRVRIHLAKHDEVPRYLAAMDLMVAPSQTMRNWKEQFGRMLIEAFACEVPVIASDSGEIPFVVGNGGFIEPEKDIEKWHRTIYRLLRDPDLRKQTGLSGYARVGQFSVAQVAGQFRAFYRELVES